MNMHIGFPRLIRVHMIIVWRQRSLWAAAVPLALFALLLGMISPAGPHDHGAGDLAFMAKTMAMFMPIAYMAAFTDFHTRHDRLGIGQLEDSTPTPVPLLTAARTLGAFLILITRRSCCWPAPASSRPCTARGGPYRRHWPPDSRSPGRPC